MSAAKGVAPELLAAAGASASIELETRRFICGRASGRFGSLSAQDPEREPEIGDVAACLSKMGATVEGIGTSVLRIQGRDDPKRAVFFNTITRRWRERLAG